MAQKNDAILGRFSDAQSVLECAVRALEGSQLPVGAESVCLRHGLALLAEVYRELEGA